MSKWPSVKLRRMASLRTEPVRSRTEFVALENLQSGTGKLLDQPLGEVDADASGVAMGLAGDVLFGKLRPYLAKTLLLDDELAASTELLCLRPFEQIDSRWFSYLVLTDRFIEEAVAGSTGTKMPRTSWDKVREFVTPLPPLADQQKIAEFLDVETGRIDRLITEYQTQNELLEAEAISIDSAFWDDLSDSPHAACRWVTSKIGSGKTPTGGADAYKPSGVPFLRSQNIVGNSVSFEGLVFIDDDTHLEMKATAIRSRDVLLNITGASIGRSAVASEGAVGGNVNQHVCIIRFTDRVIPEFAQLILRSQPTQELIRSWQVGGNREGLNFEQVGDLPIPVPPIIVQESIVSLASYEALRLNRLRSELDAQIENLRELRQALISTAVSEGVDACEAIAS